MKFCSKCKTPKETSEFYADKSKKDGLMYQCKGCHDKRTADYRARNRQKVNARDAIWGNKNKDKIKQSNKKQRVKNRQQRKEAKKSYYKKNPHLRNKYVIKWKQSNPEKHLISEIKSRFKRKGIKISNDLAQVYALSIKGQRLIKQLKQKT